ncbi:MAG: hypothetical protein M0Z44_02520 [Gammaproteobacteria bacterium]|nr:hypothetical protein [Gammaproteobacteria bacterium]
MAEQWLQIRGDPAVRQFLFQQQRVENDFDRQINQVLARIRVLIVNRGAFHAQIQFSTGEVTLWFLREPLSYRIHLMEEFLSYHICRCYPPCPYPESRAAMPAEAIGRVLAQFKRLRHQDPQLYLRTGSLNIMNGVVGLRFSCDGSHYLGYREFLARAGEMNC